MRPLSQPSSRCSIRVLCLIAAFGGVGLGYVLTVVNDRATTEFTPLELWLPFATLLGMLSPRLRLRRAANAKSPIPPPPEQMDWRMWAGIGVAMAAAFVLSFSLSGTMHNRVPFIFFYPVVAVAGYLGGWRPAMAVGGFAAIVLYFWHPALRVEPAEAAVFCVLFLLTAGFMGWLSEQLHLTRETARAGAAALRDLPEAQARFAAIAQTSPDALWILDANSGRLIFISRASKKLTGFTPTEACAQTKEENWARIHPDEHPVVKEALKALAAAEMGQTVEYEYRHRHRDGSWRWLRNRAGVFSRNPNGTVAQIFGHSEDVTDRREAADRLAAQADELARIAVEREATLREREELLEAERAARAEAERANRLKDDFLATVSHELRTPLTAMLGWTSMLNEEAQDPELRQGLDVITRNARVQKQLIEDLLDMSRIMSGKLRIEPQPVLVGEVVDAAIETVAPAAEARGVSLVAQIQGCEEPIQADADRLQQIVWNLLSNGVKFTPAGGQVCVHAMCTDEETTISVADTGQGMAPDFVPHVFERFRQEDAATTRKAGGLGLGLAIVKHLVELHGGEVRAHSKGIGHGSVFTISLPRHITPLRFVHSGVTAKSAASVAELPRNALAGRRLLIIDDEADTRSFLHRVLTERGAQVAVAHNAADGLRRTLADKPEAVICDISMPGEDGYSFIRHLRRVDEDGVKTTPTAALTALARAEDRQRAIDAGFDEHCAKPIEPTELVALVARLLETRGSYLA